MKRIKLVSAAALLVLLIVVLAQNTETVETRLLFATLIMPRALLLLLTLSSGVAIGLLLGSRIGRPPAA